MSKIYISLFLITSLLFSVELVVEPYLQNATPSTMTILWETDTDSPSRVEWGQAHFLDQLTMGSSFANYGTSKVHTVELENLIPNTRYYYRVVIGNF